MAAVVSLVARIKDSEGDGKLAACVLHAQAGDTLAHYQAFCDAWLPHVDDITGGQIVEASITIPLTLVAGLKANPLSGHYNERGVNFLMDVALSGFNESVRIPAVLESLVVGNSVDLTVAPGSDIPTFLTGGDGIVFPKTRAGLDFLGSGISAKRTFRRK